MIESSLDRKKEIEKEYQRKDKEVKKSARKDKRKYIQDLSTEAEEAARMGNTATVYKITKKLCGKNFHNSKPVKAKSGDILSSDKEQGDRWTEHFKETLNQPPPTEELEIEDNDNVMNIETEKPTRVEILRSIKALKKNKAPGIDSLQAELLQADSELTTDILSDLMNVIWEEETLPRDWQQGLIVKLPKKGDLSNCDNWRGITLLSVPSKVFCKILLQRIEGEIDKKLREEQAGFRRNRGCIDQIFALRNILEQCTEYNEQIHLNFIDFKKAFDSLHREAIWKILKKYGLPDKMIRLIKLFYLNYECSVILGDKLSDWFSVETGVRQGCILSPILFLITIDYVMRQTCDRPRGIQWTLFKHLEDLDFADDLALISRRLQDLQEKTCRLSNFAAKTGLAINISKTKSMHAPDQDSHILIDNHRIETVENFIYLGSVISIDNGAEKDIKNRLNKAKGCFAVLQPVWRNNQYSRKTKIRIFKSNVLSILLYGAECWRITRADVRMLEKFQNKCLRQICRIFYPEMIFNLNLLQLTNMFGIEKEMSRRRH